MSFQTNGMNTFFNSKTAVLSVTDTYFLNNTIYEMTVNYTIDYNTTVDVDSNVNVLKDITMGVILGFLCLLTVIGNSLVLHAVHTEKRLQTVSNMFIVSLAIADLIVGVAVMPISAIYIFTEDWLFGIIICQFWNGVDYIASTASILNLFILSLDRYWSVKSPLKYLRKRTKQRAIIMISLVWFASSLWLIPIVGWHYFEHDGNRTVPSNECDTEYANNVTFKILTAIINFYLPLFIMYVLYGRIFLEIRKRSRLELGQYFTGRRNSSSRDDISVPHASSIAENLPYYCDLQKLTNYNKSLAERNSKFECDDNFCYCSDYDSNVSEIPNTSCKSFNHSSSRSDNFCLSSDLEDDYTGAPSMSNSLVIPKNGKFNSETTQFVCINAKWRKSDINRSSIRDNISPNKTSECSMFLQLSSKFQNLEIYKKKNCNFASRKIDFRHITKKHKLQRKGSTIPGLIQNKTIKKRSYFEKTFTPSKFHKNRRGSHRISVSRPSIALSREIKAARQLGVIMGAFTVCFFPYFVIFMVVAFCNGKCVSKSLVMSTTWIGYFNSTLNPFLYPLCNATFRRTFYKMLRLSSPSKTNCTLLNHSKMQDKIPNTCDK